MPITRTVNATDIHAVRFATEDTGWAVGAEADSSCTATDGGKTWRNSTYVPADLSEAITWNTVATHGSHVWIAGSPGTVMLHSPDNGESWQGHSTGNHTPLNKLVFVDETHGWAVGDLGTVLHTNDGGQTWQPQRRGGERAAVLVLASDVNQLPLATLAKLSGDGYRTVVHLFAATGAPDDPTRWARVNEALSNLGCNSVTQSSSATDPGATLAEVTPADSHLAAGGRHRPGCQSGFGTRQTNRHGD